MAGHAHAHGDDNVNVEHESSDINVRAIVWFAVVLAVIVLIIDVAMYGTFRLLNHLETVNQPFVSPTAPPEALNPQWPAPGLQTTPWEDLKVFKAQEESYVNGYVWLDQQAGIAHIPIERAKALLLQRGLPTRAAQGTPDPSEGTHAYAYGESNGGRGIEAGGADMSTANGAAAAAAQPAPEGHGAASTATTKTPPTGRPGGAV